VPLDPVYDGLYLRREVTTRRKPEPKTLGRPKKNVDTAHLLALHAAGNGSMKIAAMLAKEGKVVSRETIRRTLRKQQAAL
jgi:hypothetical protein